MNVFKELIAIDKENNISITGLTDAFFCAYLNAYKEKYNKDILIVVPTLYEANKIYTSLLGYNLDCLLFPMDDFLTSEAISISPDLKISRLECLNELISDNRNTKIVITHLDGYLRFLPTKQKYKDASISLEVNQTLDPKQLVQLLLNIGYKRETLVTTTGELGVRGFVIDVFPLGENHPVRIEFFGDDIDSIRYFDETTQKSIKEIEKINIRPNTEDIFDEVTDASHKYLSIVNKNLVNIEDYLENCNIFYKDISQMTLVYKKMEEDAFHYKIEKDKNFNGKYFLEWKKIYKDKAIKYYTIDNFIQDQYVQAYDSKDIPDFHSDIHLIDSYLTKNIHNGYTICICVAKNKFKNIKKYLTSKFYETTIDAIKPNCVNLVDFNMNSGFSYKNYIFITSKELFKEQTKTKYKTKLKYTSKINDINKLNIGDYIVHSIHGIGIYNGIKSLKKGDLIKDYLEVLYQGKDKLYIPVEKIDLINKFCGKEGAVPKINKLGSSEWYKTKARVREKVKNIASTLLQIYAKREIKEGFAFSKDTELQIQFEEEFPYTYTKDQALATDQIKEDMEKKIPMDRLLCGDVGYGKTEVAFRAMFKAVCDSKQVLYLCPTTILSNQVYENAKERFKNFPVNIGLLNRFTTPKEVKQILKELEEGTIDIVVGTHRILSNDINPKQLGLLVIDEEQRFGVMHKERIKQYKENVDVLTLTATPIPRTLQMSMVGLRSLSMIETPPVDRYPVQTYVIEDNNQIVRDAIYKEMSRGGQVFLLYNKVESIETEVRKIEKLVPDARIIFAHGQMSKAELEKRMQDFIDYKYDVLVCTTIIETGIDIPNVNTLIIKDADKFGLAQLYQIRGRVGRSNKIAYAYLMYQGGKVLTETALKRLNVIKDFTELGSGFSIATRDLSIRGAGDILGSQQAGFIDSIGIDLYIKILNEEVEKLKGNQVEEEKEETPLIDVSTHIKDEYVDDADLKIEIHKLINKIDSYESLKEIKTIIEDRFGKIEEDLLIYMYEEWFEKISKGLEIEKVMKTKTFIDLTFSENISKKIDAEKLFVSAFEISKMFRFQSKNNKLHIILDTVKYEKHYIYDLTKLLDSIEFLD